MFREIDDTLMFEDGKTHYMKVGEKEYVKKGEIRIVDDKEKLLVSMDASGRLKYYLSGTINQKAGAAGTGKRKAGIKAGRCLDIPPDNTYFVYNDKYFRAYLMLYFGRRQYYVALSINGLIKAFDAMTHIPITKEEIKALYDKIRVNSFSTSLLKQMYKRVLML